MCTCVVVVDGGGGGVHYFLYLCDPIGCECDQRQAGSSPCRREKMVEKPDQRASAIIFCECSLSTIPLSKSSLCLSLRLPHRGHSLTNSHAAEIGGGEPDKWEEGMCGENEKEIGAHSLFTTNTSFCSLCRVRLSSLYCLFMCFLGCHGSFSCWNTPPLQHIPLSISSSDLTPPHATHCRFPAGRKWGGIKQQQKRRALISPSNPAWTDSLPCTHSVLFP